MPNVAEPVKARRRWFQFRLRTLLIGMALVALPCGYVESQVRIVEKRKEVRARAEQIGAYFCLEVGDALTLPWSVRHLLGDKMAGMVFFPAEMRQAEADEVKAAFPELRDPCR
jgi:hypothetical protein